MVISKRRRFGLRVRGVVKQERSNRRAVPRGTVLNLRTSALQNAKWLQGGLVFKAHRWLYHSTLGSRVTKKKKKGRALCENMVKQWSNSGQLGVVRQEWSNRSGQTGRARTQRGASREGGTPPARKVSKRQLRSGHFWCNSRGLQLGGSAFLVPEINNLMVLISTTRLGPPRTISHGGIVPTRRSLGRRKMRRGGGQLLKPRFARSVRSCASP